jgi:response regulator RpfG family c-di-GMP phosphodiesterase
MSQALNILVVDDDPQILEVFEEFFESTKDYSVITAQNGAQALTMCQNNRVDFCFTDLKMPEMDGIEFIDKIQNVDNTIPVVAMTGYPSWDNAIATMKNGVVDFLVKPFKIESIGLTIQNALEKRDLLVENMLLKEEVKSNRRLVSVNRELSDKVNDLKVLNKILQKVDWFGPSADLFDRIVRLSGEITRGDESYFHILDESLGRPVLVASYCREKREPDPDRLTVLEGILTDRMGDGMPLFMGHSCDASMNNSGIGSLIATPLKIRDNTFGMVTGVMVRQEATPFSEKDLYYLNFMARRAAFVIENVALYENIYENLFATLYAFVEAIEARDPYTKQHSSRVAEIALTIGQEMGCSHEELDRLGFSGHLHDIGKIGIRDSILLKPSRLTQQEFRVIKRHPTIGANIIGHLGLMSEEQKIIRHHHERWDGSGYPDGLQGEAIPFLSRILAVADVYDAMASDRAYRKKIADDIIIETIQSNAGTQFDQDVVAGFLRAYESGAFSSKENLDVVNPKPLRNKIEVGVLSRLSVNASGIS